MGGERHARLNRMRWHSRRALLELDLVLQRYWSRHGDTVDAADEVALVRLLELEDHELWGLVSGREVTGDQEMNRMLGRLRETGAAPGWN